MTNSFTDEQIAEIEDRLTAATPRPWYYGDYGRSDIRALLDEVKRLRALELEQRPTILHTIRLQSDLRFRKTGEEPHD